MMPRPLFLDLMSRQCGLCRCCVAAWFSTAAADSWFDFAMIQYALQPGWWRCVSFFSRLPRPPPPSQMFASHIANTCIFFFLFEGGQQFICFLSNRRVEFWHIQASVVELFLFATAMCCIFLCFNEYWFGFLKSSCWCFSYHFLSMAANTFDHHHISWVFIHLTFATKFIMYFLSVVTTGHTSI